MKIRSDYVTNSSSSSFIIARRANVPRERFEEVLLGHKGDLMDFLHSRSGEIPCENHEIILHYYQKNNVDIAVIYLIEAIIDEIIKLKGMQLDDWIVYPDYVNDYWDYEDSLIVQFLNYCWDLNTDILKIKEFN